MNRWVHNGETFGEIGYDKCRYPWSDNPVMGSAASHTICAGHGKFVKQRKQEAAATKLWVGWWKELPPGICLVYETKVGSYRRSVSLQTHMVASNDAVQSVWYANENKTEMYTGAWLIRNGNRCLSNNVFGPDALNEIVGQVTVYGTNTSSRKASG